MDPTVAQESEARTKPPTSREILALEQAALGGFEQHPGYRLDTANVPSMLVQALSRDGGEGVVATGLVRLANEMTLLTMSFENNAAVDNEVEPAILISVMHGIESRLRILAQIAKRTLDVADVERST